MVIAINKLRAAAKALEKQVGDDPEKARETLRSEGVLSVGGKIRIPKGSHQMGVFLNETTGGGSSALKEGQDGRNAVGEQLPGKNPRK